MPPWWPALVFGWPAVGLALVLAVTGIARNKPVLILASIAPAFPFSLYLAGAQNWMAFVGLSVPIALIGSAYAVRRRALWIAWGLLTSVVAALASIAVIIGVA